MIPFDLGDLGRFSRDYNVRRFFVRTRRLYWPIVLVISFTLIALLIESVIFFVLGCVFSFHRFTTKIIIDE